MISMRTKTTAPGSVVAWSEGTGAHGNQPSVQELQTHVDIIRMSVRPLQCVTRPASARSAPHVEAQFTRNGNN